MFGATQGSSNMAKAHIHAQQMKEWIEFRDEFVERVTGGKSQN